MTPQRSSGMPTKHSVSVTPTVGRAIAGRITPAAGTSGDNTMSPLWPIADQGGRHDTAAAGEADTSTIVRKIRRRASERIIIALIPLGFSFSAEIITEFLCKCYVQNREQ
jgi:hypothetical protein